MLRVAPLPLVATYAYVNPVVAVILGALVLGEAIEPRTVLAGAVIIFAVALIVTARGRMTRPGQVDAGDGGSRRASPGQPRDRRRAGAQVRLDALTQRASGLGQDHPRQPAGHGHDRDHRVDPDAGREDRPVADVQAAHDRLTARSPARTRPHGSQAASRGVGTHPDRAHLVGREDGAAVRCEVEGPQRVLEPREAHAPSRRTRRLTRGTTPAESRRRRCPMAPAARTNRAIETSA